MSHSSGQQKPGLGLCLLHDHGFWAGWLRVYSLAGFACGAPEEVLSFNFVDCFHFVSWPQLHEFMTVAVVHVPLCLFYVVVMCLAAFLIVDFVGGSMVTHAQHKLQTVSPPQVADSVSTLHTPIMNA